MIYYLLLPVVLFLLVIVQITILDLFSFGWIGIEISIIIVIYAGFHLDALRGGILSLLIGFYLDCLTSTIFGLYMFLYIVIYYLSMIVGGKIYAGKPVLIGCFVAFCTLLEGLVVVLLYRFIFGADVLYAIPKIFVPQAIAAGFLGPLFFRLFKRFEVLLDVEDRQPARRI
jgi:rod shape-determining protein MreD